METTHNKLQHNFFLILFIIVGILMLLVFRPFLAPLVIALSFAVVFKPMYRRLSSAFGGRESIAALLSVLIIVCVILIPLMVLGGLLFNEAQDVYVSLSNYGDSSSIIAKAANTTEQFLQRFAPDISIDVTRYAQSSLQWTLSHLDSFFSGFIRIILGLFIVIIALFYLLRDGGKLREKYVELSPLSDTYDNQIITKIIIAINSVIKGSLVIALVQGILAALGVWLFGISNPILWGVCATISSLIPGVGTSLVMGPAIIYLFFTGSVGAGVGLLIWQVLVVGLVDNFMTPMLLRRGIKVHSFFILMSVLGGIVFFGPIGFLLGPILLALFFALLDIYPLVIN